jgi:hypothetical protein
MMTPALCTEKAEMCDAQASSCAGTPFEAHWREMATHWRGLAGDGTTQATVARLMSASRQSRA